MDWWMDGWMDKYIERYQTAKRKLIKLIFMCGGSYIGEAFYIKT